VQRRIQTLPTQLANQIAAGEVVERPSSVVKELMENSLDAGAGRIELEVEQGGTKLIRIQDDGRGIVREDLALAVAPHATSKIYTQKELEQIASLGFRGEALASIASVSRFSLASCAEGEDEGWELQCDGPSVGEPVPYPIPRGTRVEVRDLFYNIPARRKFLRSERTEFLHLEGVVKRLALSRFDVAFNLVHNGRQLLRLRPAVEESQQARRISDVLGRGFIQQALKLDFAAAGLRLWGWLARPDASRSQADSQYFYLNGRMIRDKLINHAVRQAHQAVLEPGRHPAYALFLELDPTQVDVNVHPTKHEVRFRESRLVHDFVFRALTNALSGEEPMEESLQLAANAQEIAEGARPSWKPAAPPGRARVAEQHAFYRQAGEPVLPEPSPNHRLGQARAILHHRFLLAEGEEGPLLVDLHAARRHMLSGHLQQMLEAGEVRSQPLLIPHTVTLESEHAEQIQGAGEILRQLGFELERLGETSMVLRRIPAMLRGAEPEQLIAELLERLEQPGTLDTLMSWLVERAVVLSPLGRLSEADSLLRQLEQWPDSGAGFWRPLTPEALENLYLGVGR